MQPIFQKINRALCDRTLESTSQALQQIVGSLKLCTYQAQIAVAYSELERFLIAGSSNSQTYVYVPS